MHKYTKITLSVIGTIIVSLVIINFLIPKPDIQQQIQDLRNKTQPEFDALTQQMVNENSFFDSIQYLIASGHLDGADNVINQLIEKNKRNDHYWTLKAKVFDARHQYDSALHYYNYAIALNPHSSATVERAVTFIKTKQYDKAIKDYRTAYENNYDFSYTLAQVFQLNKQKDSALKYYSIYLEHYPDSLYHKLLEQGIYIKYPPDSARANINRLKNN